LEFQLRHLVRQDAALRGVALPDAVRRDLGPDVPFQDAVDTVVEAHRGAGELRDAAALPGEAVRALPLDAFLAARRGAAAAVVRDASVVFGRLAARPLAAEAFRVAVAQLRGEARAGLVAGQGRRAPLPGVAVPA
jgi:hypothetical protein